MMDIENCASTTPRSNKQFNIGSQEHLKLPKVMQINDHLDDSNEHTNRLHFTDSNAVSKSQRHSSSTTPPQKTEMLSHDDRLKMLGSRNRFTNISPLCTTTTSHENFETSNTTQQQIKRNGVIVNLQIQESNSLPPPILNESHKLDNTKRLTAVKFS